MKTSYSFLLGQQTKLTEPDIELLCIRSSGVVLLLRSETYKLSNIAMIKLNLFCSCLPSSSWPALVVNAHRDKTRLCITTTASYLWGPWT